MSRAYAHYLAAMAQMGRADADAGRAAASSGWEQAEIAAALTFTGRRADHEYSFAQMLVLRLPLVFAALEAGDVDHHKARVYADHLEDLTGPQIELICRRLLPRTPGWTTSQLAARLLREIHAVDRAYTRRRYERAVRERGVSGVLAPDGTATISAHGLTPSAAADRLDAAVRRAGHPGSVHQVRADLFVRLLDGRYDSFMSDQIVAAMMSDAGEGPGGEHGTTVEGADTAARARPDRDRPPTPGPRPRRRGPDRAHHPEHRGDPHARGRAARSASADRAPPAQQEPVDLDDLPPF